MFKSLFKLWNERGFEFVFAVSILFLIIYAFMRRNSKGTYSREIPRLNRRRPPQTSKGEIRCRKYLEYKFRKPFIKSRPDFLRNPVTGGNYNLELDCYNEEMRLAVEYNGVQHYKFVPYFHKNKEAFLNQKYRDELKRIKCKENGIRLIEVPYNIEKIEEYLEEKLKLYGH